MMKRNSRRGCCRRAFQNILGLKPIAKISLGLCLASILWDKIANGQVIEVSAESIPQRIH